MQRLFKTVNQLNIFLKSYQDTKIAKHFAFIALSNFYMYIRSLQVYDRLKSFFFSKLLLHKLVTIMYILMFVIQY